MASSITNMPLDIWREILVRLPAESLIRGRAVSKGWGAVIDDPCFVRAHTNNLQHHQLSSSKIIIQSTTYYSAVGSCYSLDLEALISCSSNGHQAAIAATPLDLDFISDVFSSSCNGLVLTKNPSFTIWNPLTHERLDLPPFSNNESSSSAAFGLGYDCATDDYKAVVILRTRHTHVYSLKSDSWRSIMNCPAGDGDWWGPVGPGVFVCGALNWLSVGEGCVYEDKIVALDVGTGKYSLLQMPHVIIRWIIPPLDNLIVLGGRLALCDYGYNSHLDVWVMKVYGDHDSWFKLFSIEQNNISAWSDFLTPVAFIMKEKLLVFLQDRCYRFFLFDVETKSLKSVNIDGSDSCSYAQLELGTIFRLHANCGGGAS